MNLVGLEGFQQVCVRAVGSGFGVRCCCDAMLLLLVSVFFAIFPTDYLDGYGLLSLWWGDGWDGRGKGWGGTGFVRSALAARGSECLGLERRLSHFSCRRTPVGLSNSDAAILRI